MFASIFGILGQSQFPLKNIPSSKRQIKNTIDHSETIEYIVEALHIEFQ